MRARCLILVPPATAGLLLLAAAPAWAHIEVEAAPARALATDATVTMLAESESVTAGVAKLRIQLPQGLVADDLRLASGPRGWRLTGSGSVVEIGGPALAVGADPEVALRIRQLPQTRQLVLKTLQTYSDGRTDSWIEVAAPGGSEPDNAAPTVALAPAAAGATPLPRETTAPPTTAPPTTASPTTASAAPSTSTPASTAAPAPAEESGGGSTARWLGAAVALGLITGGAIAWRRRRATG